MSDHQVKTAKVIPGFLSISVAFMNGIKALAGSAGDLWLIGCYLLFGFLALFPSPGPYLIIGIILLLLILTVCLFSATPSFGLHPLGRLVLLLCIAIQVFAGAVHLKDWISERHVNEDLGSTQKEQDKANKNLSLSKEEQNTTNKNWDKLGQFLAHASIAPLGSPRPTPSSPPTTAPYDLPKDPGKIPFVPTIILPETSGPGNLPVPQASPNSIAIEWKRENKRGDLSTAYGFLTLYYPPAAILLKLFGANGLFEEEEYRQTFEGIYKDIVSESTDRNTLTKLLSQLDSLAKRSPEEAGQIMAFLTEYKETVKDEQLKVLIDDKIQSLNSYSLASPTGQVPHPTGQ